jgi:hypothetical protein
MTDQLHVWYEALAGRFDDTVKGEPSSGYWRYPRQDGTWSPIMVMTLRDGRRICEQDFKAVEPTFEWCERVFSRASRHPVTYHAYKRVQQGETWPDAPPPEPSNLPTDPAERFAALLDDARERFASLKKNPPTTDEEAGAVVAFITQVATYEDEAEALRVAEKKPHDDASRKVQAKWSPLVVGFAGAVKALKNEILLPFNQAKRAAEAEEERKRLAAARLKYPVGEAPSEPEPALQPTRAVKGAFGRTVSVRTRRVAKVNDYAAAIAALIDNPDLRREVDRLAQKVIAAGGELPGVSWDEQESMT